MGVCVGGWVCVGGGGGEAAGATPSKHRQLSKLAANFIKPQAVGLAWKALHCGHPACLLETATCPAHSARPGPGGWSASDPVARAPSALPAPPPAAGCFSPTSRTWIFSAFLGAEQPRAWTPSRLSGCLPV